MNPARLALLGLCLALCAMAGLARAQAVSEAALKAAFLYKFAGYVEWPAAGFPAPDAPFVIAVAGASEVAAELERLVPARTVHNRRIEVRRVSGPEGLAGASMLFVGRGSADGPAMLAAGQRRSLLTVSESDRGLDHGSMINFVAMGDRVTFDVSLEPAERAGLRISSRMLAVARRVQGKG